MWTTTILTFAVLVGHALGHGPHRYGSYRVPTAASSDLQTAYSQLQDLIAHANTVSRARAGKGIPGSGCSPDKIRVRRKWEALSSEERIAYSSAVRCMQKLPAKSNSTWAPGAKTRFDDFVATHAFQTLDIHESGTFLGYHRWHIAEFERVSREECGYNGTQPYWDWALTAMTGLETSPLFDGSATSMGGNGEYIPVTEPYYYPKFKATTGPEVEVPAGTGGGCVKHGLFSDYIVNMGPYLRPLPGRGNRGPTSQFLAYNPRCLKRDLSDAINQQLVNATKIVNTIIKPQTIEDFQIVLQGADTPESFGVHGDGHLIVGGDPGGDLGGNGPAEPTFYMLHSAVDLYWWVWQTLDWERRTFGEQAISGTNTGLNMPPSANTTFETELNMHYAGRNATMAEVISTVDGQLCYVYE